MGRPCITAFACAACLVAPMVYGQQQEPPRAEITPTTAHSTLSPIGKAMAELLRQASPAQAQPTHRPGADPSSATAAGPAPPHPHAAEPSPASEVAVQPPG